MRMQLALMNAFYYSDNWITYFLYNFIVTVWVFLLYSLKQVSQKRSLKHYSASTEGPNNAAVYYTY